MRTFGQALDDLKMGNRVARAGWNGKGMFLILIQGHDYYFANTPVPLLGTVKLPWIAMKTANNEVVPWLASQTDMLAADWEIVT